MFKSNIICLFCFATLTCSSNMNTAKSSAPSSKPDYGLQAVPAENFTNSVDLKMVKTTDGYWVGATEVTELQYAVVRGKNSEDEIKLGIGLPVRSVTWFQATDFCDLLTEREREKGLLPKGYKYSLPTEKQWRSFVADAKLKNAVVNNYTESLPNPVASKSPNRLGLYDVRGNLSEWCLEWYGRAPRAKYASRLRRSRVLRGASFKSSSEYKWDIDYRFGINGPASINIGFRVVLIPEAAHL